MEHYLHTSCNKQEEIKLQTTSIFNKNKIENLSAIPIISAPKEQEPTSKEKGEGKMRKSSSLDMLQNPAYYIEEVKKNLENIPESNTREFKIDQKQSEVMPVNQSWYEFKPNNEENSNTIKQAHRVSTSGFSPVIIQKKGFNSWYNERMTNIDHQNQYIAKSQLMKDLKLAKTNSANIGVYQSLGANNYNQNMQYNNQSYTFNPINHQSFSPVHPSFDLMHTSQGSSHHSYWQTMPYSSYEREAYSPDAINRNRLEYVEYRRLSSNEAIYQNKGFSDFTSGHLNHAGYSHSSGMSSNMHEFKLNLIGESSQSSNIDKSISNQGDDYEYYLSKELDDLTLGSESSIIKQYEKSSQMAKDQSGWRLLQKKIDEGDPDTFIAIYTNILPNFVDLMNNSFGNYLCQKITEKWNREQIKEIIHIIEKDILEVCCNSYGTRSVQKIIEWANNQELVNLIINLLKDHVKNLVEDTNGNHAIQKALVVFKPTNNEFIFDKMIEYCKEIACHKHGWCVMQKWITNANPKQQKKLVGEIISNTIEFVRDPYGNYVIQYVLDLQNIEFNSEIGYQLLGSIISLRKYGLSY